MTDLLAAAGLAVALEGALYALAPGAMRDMMRLVADSESETLRSAGLVALVVGVGVGVVWMVRPA